VLEAVLDFMTEECKVNFLDVQKSLDILKISTDSFPLDREEHAQAPQLLQPSADHPESNAL
jgi:hypothetical protein